MRMLDRNDEPFADDPEGLKEYKRHKAMKRRAAIEARKAKAAALASLMGVKPETMYRQLLAQEKEGEENAKPNT